MISANNVTLRVGKKALFEEVNIKFTEGNCYGLIGANGAGKSTFLKILSGQLEPTNGEVAITPGERLSFLQQDHFKYDEYPVLDTVIMGNARLYEIMKEKEAIYAKEDFTDEDGIKASELEGEFATMNGWEAESDAASLLNGLGIETDLHYKMMKDMTGPQKVKVLLAQALFGNPDILLLDEPTNHLDLDAIAWLEEFLINFENTVIVVSHDRYFLNKVCTQIADIDYGKIQLYAGNYDFWYESSQLLIRQMKEANKKKEEKIKELQDFISRFSANASKSKQATSRKRALEKIQLDEIKPSSRKYPYIDFRPNREIGNEVLTVEGLSKTIDGVKVLDNISFTLGHDDKVAFVGSNEVAKTVLFKILIGEMEPDEGTYKWGVTTSQAYFPKDFGGEFDSDYNITEWLTQYSEEKDVTYVRGFLGRMLFSGEDGVKKLKVLSGGEKVRCLLSKMMISGANVLLLDEPTNHLDIESIQWLERFLQQSSKAVILVSHDRAFINNVTNRTLEISCGKIIDYKVKYDEYIKLRAERREQQIHAYENQQKEIADIKDFIERFRYKATKAVQVQSRIKQLEKIVPIEIDEVDRSSMHLKFPPCLRSGDYPVICDEVGKQYGTHTVFENVTFTIKRGEKVAFVGRNGSGKSTLIKCIMGEIPYSGTLKIGHNVQIGYFAQNQAQLLDGSLSVFETIDNVAKGEIRLKINNILGAFMFGGEASEKKVRMLSGGERSRLAMIRLLLEPVNLLILDEPTNHLDMQSKEVLKEAIKAFDGTAIIVSHDRDFLDGLVSKVYEFADGSVTEHLGGIYDYLYKRNIESPDELAAPKKNLNAGESLQDTISSQKKNNYIEHKEIQKKIRRIEKTIKESEQRIEVLENKIKTINDKLCTPEGAADMNLIAEYTSLKGLLEEEENTWTSLSEKLEEEQNKLSY